MTRLFFALAASTIVLLICGCKKHQQPPNTILTGTWIKGAFAGDTLYFTKTDDRNILRYNLSFNAALPAFTETDYRFANGKLAIKNSMTTGNDFYVIRSFNWIREGTEFDILGYEMFPFMASMGVHFTYRKIN